MARFHSLSGGRSRWWINEVFSSPLANNQKLWQVSVASLSLVSLFSIYTIFVQVGVQRFAPESTGSSVAVLQSKTEDGFDEPTRPHHLRQSPPSLLQNVLGIPQGGAVALPSLRVPEAMDQPERKSYGGVGDKPHLGGFTIYDGMGVSPAVWKHMISHMGVKSMMDVGCGRGTSTLFFLEHGVDVLCVEGSHDGVEQTFLPDRKKQIVEHDYSRGPYWPGKTYDAVWSVEFLEHVGRNYQFNYIQTYRKAALLFVTHSRWGGWHHVEVHMSDWWISKFQMFGFHYSEILTNQIRSIAMEEANQAQKAPEEPGNLGLDGEAWNSQHIWLNMMVFVNPAVASLPEHAHLLAEPGCYKGRDETDEIEHRDCTEENESKLPDSYSPLTLTPEQQASWFSKVKARIDASKQ